MLKCLLYIAFWGLAAFPLGKFLRRRRFDPEALPYRPCTFEKGGALYERMGVKRWCRLLPDISRSASGYMPEKKLGGSAADIYIFIQETCVAELVHWLLCLAGLPCLLLWPGGGLLVFLIYVIIGNLPYIVIQRYNRPRLLRVYRRMLKREEALN